MAWVKLPPLPRFLPPPGWDALVETWHRADGLFFTLSPRGAEVLGVHLVEVSAGERADFREGAVGDVAWDLPIFDKERDLVFLPAGTEQVYRWANVGEDGPEPRETPERPPAGYVRRVRREAANLRPARDGEPRRARVRPTRAAEARMAAIRAV